MSDFETLRSRVDEAADKLATAEADRHHHAGSLSGLLVKLEERFEAQCEELAFYKARVRPLEDINHQLADLMDRLLTMIDQGFGEASVAPIRDAASAAARILGTDAPDAGSEFAETDDAAEPESGAEPAAEAEDDDPEGMFDDVGVDALLAEAEAEADDGADAEMPEIVADAHIAALSDEDPLAEVLEAIAAVDAEVGASDAVTDDVTQTMEELARRIAADSADHADEDGDRVDIRSLLARVEAAVEEVRLSAAPVGVQEFDDADELPSSAVA